MRPAAPLPWRILGTTMSAAALASQSGQAVGGGPAGVRDVQRPNVSGRPGDLHGPVSWWIGYLDIGSDIVFWDAPKVTLYYDWRYVLVLAGPDQAAAWRPALLDVRIVPLGPRGPAPLAPPNAVTYVMSGMPLRCKRSSIPRMSL